MHNVCFDDGVMSIVGTDQQLFDISRFCAHGMCKDGSIVGVDSTFNLGDFYVTPTVYEHRLIVNKRTGKHPIFIGPVLIHRQKVLNVLLPCLSDKEALPRC